MPFQRGTWMVMPLDSSSDDHLIPQKRYPIDVKPRTAETFFLADMNKFRRMVQDIWQDASMLDRIRLRFLHAHVLSGDGETFKVKLDNEVRRELRKSRGNE
jgi:hypothetical protein